MDTSQHGTTNKLHDSFSGPRCKSLKWALVIWVAALTCTAPGADSYVNFEGKLTRPICLSPDGTRLFAVNTADGRLSVFDVTHPLNPFLTAEIPVGIEPVSVNAVTNDPTAAVIDPQRRILYQARHMHRYGRIQTSPSPGLVFGRAIVPDNTPLPELFWVKRFAPPRGPPGNGPFPAVWNLRTFWDLPAALQIPPLPNRTER